MNIQLIAREAKKIYSYEDWRYHILVVLRYARLLRKRYRADREILELAVYLHDITRTTGDKEKHHLTGAALAKKILIKNGYPLRIVRAVRHCILSHRASSSIKPRTREAVILFNADAMAHFDIVPLFFYWRAKKNSLEETRRWVLAKLERDWRKKLSLPFAREVVSKKYQAARLLLKAKQ